MGYSFLEPPGDHGIGIIYRLEISNNALSRAGTPLFGLYEDVPLDRVWFLTSLL